MLTEYLEKYYVKLQSDLQELSDFFGDSELIIKILNLWEKNRDFILNWDNSSIINFLYLECIQKKPQWLWNHQFYAEKLLAEMELFLDWKTLKLRQNQGTQIAGTNIRLSLNDNNPYGKMDAHPDHQTTWWVKWWWEKSEKEWLDIYEKTFNLLRETDEWFYDELNKIITKIIPLWTAKGLHNSASYKECIWHLYMWYTIDSDTPELNNLEAIIHESSHNKINLIKQFDPLVLSNYETKYYSPYRPDARHIHWVFLGIQAFVPVIYILMQTLNKWSMPDSWHWKEKIFLYYLKNKFCLRVLKKHWKFSELWTEIMDEIEEVMWMTDVIYKTITIDETVILNAKNAMIAHFQEVNKNYPHLEY